MHNADTDAVLTEEAAVAIVRSHARGRALAHVSDETIIDAADDDVVPTVRRVHT